MNFYHYNYTNDAFYDFAGNKKRVFQGQLLFFKWRPFQKNSILFDIQIDEDLQVRFAIVLDEGINMAHLMSKNIHNIIGIQTDNRSVIIKIIEKTN